VRHSAVLCLIASVAVIASVAPPARPAEKQAGQTQPATTPGPAAPADNRPTEKKTDAERVVELERSIQDTEKQLAELKTRLESPESEYAKAKAEFTELDRQLEEKKQQLKHLQEAGSTVQADALQGEIDKLRKTRDLAKERFDLAIQEQNALGEKVATLEKKLLQDREAVTRLQTPPQATTKPGDGPAIAPQPAETPAGVTDEQKQAPSEKNQKEPGQVAPPATVAPAPAPVNGQSEAEKGTADKPAEPPTVEVVKAQEQAQEKEAQAQLAEEAAQSITERVQTLTTAIENERKLLETARKKTQNARETQYALSEQAREKSAEGGPREEAEALWAKVRDARQRSAQAEAEVAQHIDRMDQLQAQLQELQADQIAALSEADRTRQEAQQAQQELEKLQSPFSPHNMLRWVYNHGPRLIGIIVGMLVLLWITRIAEHRIVRLLMGSADHGAPADRENRAKTLTSVFHNAAFIAIIIAGVFMVLAEIEVNIAPLLGGAAVVGLAVAFGAQSLIKDYFYGFIILLENQYTVNDVIKIGDTAGLVEHITLRMTVLRDLEGVVHFIPHGEAAKVSNLTHGWSRTVLDIGVSYNEDADNVMKVLTQIGKELYQDPNFEPLMLGEPEILGLDALGDSAIVIKLIVKTRPLQQWTIKREFLRRIKKRFDEVGIEIPYPHRTVYHRWEEGRHPPAFPPAGSPPPTDA